MRQFPIYININLWGSYLISSNPNAGFMSNQNNAESALTRSNCSAIKNEGNIKTGGNMVVRLELVTDNSRKDVAMYELYKLYVRKNWTPMTYDK